MNLQDFQQLSKRTMPFNGEPQNKVEYGAALINYSMGLMGEMVEFGEVLTLSDVESEKAKLEAGDVLHYAVGLLTILEVDADSSYLPLKEQETMYSYPGEILEIVKKFAFHGHELNKHRIIDLTLSAIDNFYNNQGAHWIEEVLNMNIDKLSKRYPDKFSTEHSIDRVDVEGEVK